MNIQEKIKKKNHLRQILYRLEKENVKMDDLIKMQKNNLGELDGKVEEKKHIHRDLKSESIEMKTNLERSFYKMRHSTLREIESNEKIRLSSITRENHYIKNILGLDVIQK